MSKYIDKQYWCDKIWPAYIDPADLGFVNNPVLHPGYHHDMEAGLDPRYVAVEAYYKPRGSQPIDPILQAVLKDDFPGLKLSIMNNTGQSPRNVFGGTPLHVAIELGGRDDIIEELCKHTGTLLLKDNNGFYPLHMAVRHGRSDDIIRTICRELHEQHGFIDAVDNYGRTALFIAAMSVKGDRPVWSEYELDYIYRISTVGILLNNGADAYFPTMNGLTALGFMDHWKNKYKRDPNILLVVQNMIHSHMGRTMHDYKVFYAANAPLIETVKKKKVARRTGEGCYSDYDSIDGVKELRVDQRRCRPDYRSALRQRQQAKTHEKRKFDLLRKNPHENETEYTYETESKTKHVLRTYYPSNTEIYSSGVYPDLSPMVSPI